MWHVDSGQLLAVHGDSAYYESLVLAGPRQIFARGLLCERILLPLENSGTEFEPEHQRWLTFSPLMAANTTKLVKNAKLSLLVSSFLFPRLSSKECHQCKQLKAWIL